MMWTNFIWKDATLSPIMLWAFRYIIGLSRLKTACAALKTDVGSGENPAAVPTEGVLSVQRLKARQAGFSFIPQQYVSLCFLWIEFSVCAFLNPNLPSHTLAHSGAKWEWQDFPWYIPAWVPGFALCWVLPWQPGRNCTVYRCVGPICQRKAAMRKKWNWCAHVEVRIVEVSAGSNQPNVSNAYCGCH